MLTNMADTRFPEADKLDDLTFRSLLSVLEGGMRLQNDIENFLKPFSISHGRFSILLTLLRNEDSDVIHKEISSFLGKSLPTITKMLARLTADGLIEVSKSAGDRRVKKFNLSIKGRNLLDEIIPAYNKRLGRMASGLDSPEKEQLISLISKLSCPGQREDTEV